MEPSSFLKGPQIYKLKIVCWNVNGVHTKIEKRHVQNVLYEYDIICLNELKTPLDVAISGYVCLRSGDRESGHRGGTAVFVKNYLSPFISRVDTFWLFPFVSGSQLELGHPLPGARHSPALY